MSDPPVTSTPDPTQQQQPPTGGMPFGMDPQTIQALQQRAQQMLQSQVQSPSQQAWSRWATSPVTGALMGAASGFGQAAMPTPYKMPFGAVLGMGMQGMQTGMQNAYRSQQEQAQAQTSQLQAATQMAQLPSQLALTNLQLQAYSNPNLMRPPYPAGGGGVGVTPPAPAQPVAAPTGGTQGGAPPALYDAIQGTEHSGPDATSYAGARGTFQVTAPFFKTYAQPNESFDNENDRVAVAKRGIDALYRANNGDIGRTAVAYFSGQGNVAPPGSENPWINAAGDRYNTVPQYVANVTNRYNAAGGTQQPLYLGDSLTSKGGIGGQTGQGKVGANPDAVLAQIGNTNVNGRDVVLSSGVSNNPADVAKVEAQIQALKNNGAKSVTLVGAAPQFGLDGQLQAIAQRNGARFVPLDPNQISEDKIHPTTAGYLSLTNQTRPQAGTQYAGPGVPPAQPAQPGTPSPAQPPGAPAGTPPQVAQLQAQAQDLERRAANNQWLEQWPQGPIRTMMAQRNGIMIEDPAMLRAQANDLRAKASELAIAGPKAQQQAMGGNFDIRGAGAVVQTPNGPIFIPQPYSTESVGPGGQKQPGFSYPPPPGSPPGTPSTFAPTTTPGGQPVIGALGPQQQEEEKAYGEQSKGIIEAGGRAPVSLQRLDVLDNAANYFRPGSSGQLRLDGAKAMTDALQTLGISAPDWLTKGAAAGETIGKEGTFLASEMTRALGSREAASVFSQIKNIQPNIEMSQGGFQVILSAIRQGLQRDQDLATFRERWVADPSHNGSIRGMTDAFEKAMPVEAYASRVVPYPMPKTKDAAIPNVVYQTAQGPARWNGTAFELAAPQGQPSQAAPPAGPIPSVAPSGFRAGFGPAAPAVPPRAPAPSGGAPVMPNWAPG